MDSGVQSGAIDLSHHLSNLARARKDSPLKSLQKYMGKPGMLMLAGGLPSPAYFPFDAISGDGLSPDSFPLESDQVSSLSWFWKLFASPKSKTLPVTVPKYPEIPGDLSLSTALQYCPATGLPQLTQIIREFTHNVFQPAYRDSTTMVHTGNTDGWFKAVLTLCNSGQGVLMAEWTYPSAVFAMAPYGIKPVPVSMDSQGIRSDALRKLLEKWDEGARNMPRPHVLYIIPVGQNPSGATMGAARKKEIYDVCVQYDVIIVEDDPYYFLQEGPYIPKSDRLVHGSKMEEKLMSDFVSSLVPSFVKFDYQGRVIRLDTFSKTIAPGCRLGWFTCNKLFAERLERIAETSSQAPCGFGQSLVTRLLLSWKYEGYMRWLKGMLPYILTVVLGFNPLVGLTEALGSQYTQRRDYFIDCLAEEFHLKLEYATDGLWEGSKVYIAYDKNYKVAQTSEKSHSKPPMFSFVPPTSGMFVWIKLNLEKGLSIIEPEQTLEMKLFVALAEEGLLVAPGFIFSADELVDIKDAHFRLSFSNAEFRDMKAAIAIFARVLRKFFKEL